MSNIIPNSLSMQGEREMGKEGKVFLYLRLWQNQRELLAIYFAGISSCGQKCTSYPLPMDFQLEILHIAYCKVGFSDGNIAYCKLQLKVV